MIPEDLLVYESCIDGKITKMTKAKECLELVHTNMYGTFSVQAWEGYGYFITFSDDYSGFEYVRRRSDALHTFIEFKARSDILLKSLRLDQGNMFSKFDYFHWSMRLFPSKSKCSKNHYPNE